MTDQGAGSRAWTRAIGDSIDQGIVIVDSKGVVDFANRRALELLACEGETAIDDCWRRLREAIAHAAARSFESVPDGGSIVVSLDPDSQQSRLRIDFHHLDGDQCGGRLLLVRDVHAMEELRENARLALRFKSLARVQAALAHDMRAPLNALVLNLAIIRQTLDRNAPADLNERCLESIDVMEGEFKRLSRMLTEMLLERRVADVPNQRFELNRFLEHFASLVKPLCRDQGVDIELDLPKAPIMLDAIPDRLKQVLMNLVMNALDAMRGGGLLSIAVAASKESARIMVSDVGPGIKPDQLERIFDFHFSTKENGSGIGLYVARAIVAELGGTISVVNRTPAGCTFTIEIPFQT